MPFASLAGHDVCISAWFQFSRILNDDFQELETLTRMAVLETGNMAPTPTEAQHLRASIAEQESEIANLERAKAVLSAQQDRLRASIRTKTNILSPIRRLPPEILSLIFLYWHDVGGVYGRSAGTPFLLSHVSSHWRKIVFSTPRLWASFTVSYRGKQLDDNSLKDLTNYLLLSRPYPLHVSIVRGGADMGNIFKALLPSLNRVQKLFVPNSPQEAWLALLNGPQTSYAMPILEDLTLYRISNPSGEVSPQLFVFRDAPLLRHVQIASLSDWLMPWSQLTKLTILDCHASKIRPIIPQCQSLVHADFAIGWDLDDNVADAPIQTLGNLSEFSASFDYHDDDDSDCMRLFQPFVMPVLEILCLTNIGGWDAHHVPLLLEYVFLRSGQSLRSLELESIKIAPGEITDVLGSLPCLESLHCSHCSIGGDEFFRALMAPAASNVAAVLVPRLRNLYVVEFEGMLERVTVQAMVDMILCRWWPNEEDGKTERTMVRWEALTLFWESNDSKGFNNDGGLQEMLQKCRSEGLKVDVGVTY